MPPVLSEKTKISTAIQKYLDKSNWTAAVSEMEKLFGLDPDPLIRVRIGDAYQKLGRKPDAVKEYVRAADLYAERGFVVKALALYKLALRLDPSHAQAQNKIEALHSNKTVSETKFEPAVAGTPAPARSIIPLFSDLTQDEFNDLTKRMVIHTAPAGKIIICEGEPGKSVFVITHGSVRVYTTLHAKQVDLAVLQSSDFFGEIAFLTGRPRTATVEAAEDTDLLEVPEEELMDLISKRPRVKEVLQKYYELRVQSTIAKVKGTR